MVTYNTSLWRSCWLILVDESWLQSLDMLGVAATQQLIGNVQRNLSKLKGLQEKNKISNDVSHEGAFKMQIFVKRIKFDHINTKIKFYSVGCLYKIFLPGVSVHCAVNCSIKSITTGWLFSGAPRGANPLVPSGPRGCLTTTILAPPRAISSIFMVFNLEMRRSGRWDVLKNEKKMRNNKNYFIKIIICNYQSFLTQQAECFLVLWLVTTTNSTSSPTWTSCFKNSIYFLI